MGEYFIAIIFSHAAAKDFQILSVIARKNVIESLIQYAMQGAGCM
jgi:hypothetical protein